ncbi:MAG: DUF3313 family protein [Luteolibacter sp.]
MKVILSASLLLLSLTSCGIEQKILPIQPTGFLTSTGTDTSKNISRLPFEHSWISPEYSSENYKNIIVRPVTTKYLDTSKWQNSKSPEIKSEAQYKKQVDALASHFSKQLNIAFSDPICIFYKTNDTSKPKTLILEVALTDAHFPDPGLEPLEIPICAFEARVRDAKTGKLISTAADRRGPDLHLDGEDTHITDNKEICSIWARQLMEASNKEIFATVRRDLITIGDE